jgi:Domain of Unknown Function (DUF349)
MAFDMSSEWGRIDGDGTVYVRTSEGERVIGSWQAGTPEEGLAFYRLRYDDLAADVALLEGRIGSPASDPTAVAAAARKLKTTVPEAAALGDLDALSTRLDGVLAKVDERMAVKRQERAAAALVAADRKRELVAEAERLATSEDWRVTGERFRAIVETWKAIRGVDRTTDGELWARFAAARRSFDGRRRSHFAGLEAERGIAAERKEKLAAEAEKLAESTEWTPTARRFRDLMTEWKAAGRASREVDDALWTRFKTAQDGFFTRRSEVFSARDEEQSANLAAKQALVAEAESIDAASDPTGARKRLRSIHERWEKIGHVPRDARDALDDALGNAEARIRDATSTSRTVVESDSPLVIRLRESLGKLEGRLARAQAAGDDALAAETAAALATQREWLAQAESVRR